jgi:Dyp-type peroxidase family
LTEHSFTGETAVTVQDTPLETSDIQGIVLTGYSHLPFSCYCFLHITNPAKAQAWLKDILPQVTHSDWQKLENGKAIKPKSALNIAIAAAGLKQLGFPKDSLDQTFPAEFREDMIEPSRANRLGDVGINAPAHWDTPWQTREIHLLLILQVSADEFADQPNLSPDEWRSRGLAKLHQRHEAHRQTFEAAGLREVLFETGYVAQDRKEHFGFHDGIAQPEIKGAPRPERTKAGQFVIKPGEFLLGYQNEDDNFPPTPTVPVSQDPANVLKDLPTPGVSKDFGKNGTYLVYRKLYQDVAKYRQHFRDRFPEAQAKERALAEAKMVGRWPSGAPLLMAPDSDNPDLANENSFYYQAKDPHGLKCPMGSHIRRSNPRDSLSTDPVDSLKNVNRRQIIRRGLIYGEGLPEGQLEDDGQSRGLLFLCLNADIRRQFEFIQQTWINNPYFNNLHDERDPLVGYNPDGSDRKMTIPQEPVAQKCSMPNFVTLKGGGYFFVPSLSALRFLASVSV